MSQIYDYVATTGTELLNRIMWLYADIAGVPDLKDIKGIAEGRLVDFLEARYGDKYPMVFAVYDTVGISKTLFTIINFTDNWQKYMDEQTKKFEEDGTFSRPINVPDDLYDATEKMENLIKQEINGWKTYDLAKVKDAVAKEKAMLELRETTQDYFGATDLLLGAFYRNWNSYGMTEPWNTFRNQIDDFFRDTEQKNIKMLENLIANLEKLDLTQVLTGKTSEEIITKDVSTMVLSADEVGETYFSTEKGYLSSMREPLNEGWEKGYSVTFESQSKPNGVSNSVSSYSSIEAAKNALGNRKDEATSPPNLTGPDFNITTPTIKKVGDDSTVLVRVTKKGETGSIYLYAFRKNNLIATIEIATIDDSINKDDVYKYAKIVEGKIKN